MAKLTEPLDIGAIDPRVIASAVEHLMPVIAHAVGVFGDEEKALHWLSTPLGLFDMKSPSQMLSLAGGVERVEQVLTRIEHNIPS